MEYLSSTQSNDTQEALDTTRPPTPFRTLFTMLREYLPSENVPTSLLELAEDLEETQEVICSVLEDLYAMDALDFNIENEQLTIIKKDIYRLSVCIYRETFGEDVSVNPVLGIATPHKNDPISLD